MANQNKTEFPFSISPFTVLIDTREQAPYSFTGINGDSDTHNTPIVVRTVSCHLPTGDYTIEGLAGEISVERKSLEDLYGTLTHGRERFERELQRLEELPGFAAVVVEAGYGAIVGCPPPESKVRPKTISRSILAFQQRYRRVHWLMLPDRRFAEITTYRIFERYWKDREERLKREDKAAKASANVAKSTTWSARPNEPTTGF